MSGLTSTVIVVDVPVLPAASTALTQTVLLPAFSSTPLLKLPLPSRVRSMGVPPFTITLAVALTSSTRPDTVRFLLLSTSPSVGLVGVMTGATRSASTVSVLVSLVAPEVAVMSVAPAALVVTSP